MADALVLDGVLQTAPRRASLSLLALDPCSPWGTGHVLPRGDLRAAPRDLLAAADRAVVVHAVSRGAHLRDRLIPWSELAPLRIGLFVALARPRRITASLARHGVTPAVVVTLADHAAPSPIPLARRLASTPVGLWLASPKCATRLDAAGIPHATLDHDVILDESLVRALAALAG
jgi:tetraacyldisaccharide-1-P 4'-kinase